MNVLSSQNKTYDLNFKSGLSNSIINEFSSSTLEKTSNYFVKNKVDTDFKHNKAIAFCCAKAIESLLFINKKFGTKFLLPNKIIVEDFTKLKGDLDDSWGICNLLPTKLYKQSDTIIPERTVFFNSNKMTQNDKRLLEYMNDVAEFQKSRNLESSNHFLIKFTHELAHSSHEANLLNHYSVNKIPQLLNEAFKSVEDQNKLKDLFEEKICNSTGANPLEVIAFDLSKVLLNPSIETLKPYKGLNLFSRFILKNNKENNLSVILKKYWNGIFEC